MAKIVKLRQTSVQRMIEDLKVMADRNEIVSIAVAAYTSDGGILTSIADDDKGNGHPFELIGGLELLKKNVMDSMVEWGNPEEYGK